MLQKIRAFSLVELMVAMALVAILAGIAVASYRSFILKANRSDAIQTLLAIQLAEEKYRMSNTTYGTLTQVWNGVTTTERGKYNLGITNNTGTSYTITATGVGDQANDSDGGSSCGTMTLTYSSGTTTKTPGACWMD